MSISSKIQSLITAANSVTGESRTDLTACVQDLKDGYGGGGGGVIIKQTSLQVPSGHWIYDIANAKVLQTAEGTNLTIDMSNVTSSLRIIHRFKTGAYTSNWAKLYSNSNNDGNSGIILGFNNTRPQKVFVGGGGSDVLYLDIGIDNAKWYYVVSRYDVVNSTLYVYLYDDDGNLLASNSATQTKKTNLGYQTETSFYNGSKDLNPANAYNDLDSVCYEIDGTVVWGKLNSKTQNMGLETT